MYGSSFVVSFYKKTRIILCSYSCDAKNSHSTEVTWLCVFTIGYTAIYKIMKNTRIQIPKRVHFEEFVKRFYKPFVCALCTSKVLLICFLFHVNFIIFLQHNHMKMFPIHVPDPLSVIKDLISHWMDERICKIVWCDINLFADKILYISASIGNTDKKELSAATDAHSSFDLKLPQLWLNVTV